MSEFLPQALCVLLLYGCCFPSCSSADSLERPMLIHRVSALGLEIWTEARPEWEVRTATRNGMAMFLAETPALVAPPAGMSWTSHPGIAFAADELREGARGAIGQAAHNYRVRDPYRLQLRAAVYGDLSGYEAEFTGDAHGVPVDVRIFCGHQLGKPAVLMHAYTLQGKLLQIGEHIRRSWTHVRYLK
jgi:hypothetical protein